MGGARDWRGKAVREASTPTIGHSQWSSGGSIEAGTRGLLLSPPDLRERRDTGRGVQTELHFGCRGRGRLTRSGLASLTPAGARHWPKVSDHDRLQPRSRAQLSFIDLDIHCSLGNIEPLALPCMMA